MNRMLCPTCDAKLKYPDEWGGKRAKCPECGHSFRLTLSVEGPAKSAKDEEMAMLVRTLKGDDFDARMRAIAALAKLGDERAVKPLVEVLRDSDVQVREEAAWALGRIAKTSAVAPLIESLRDLAANVRLKAAQSLGQIKDARAVEPLVAALRDPDNGVRFYVAGALGKIGDVRAVEPLLAALRNSDEDLRRKIESSLMELGWVDRGSTAEVDKAKPDVIPILRDLGVFRDEFSSIPKKLGSSSDSFTAKEILGAKKGSGVVQTSRLNDSRPPLTRAKPGSFCPMPWPARSRWHLGNSAGSSCWPRGNGRATRGRARSARITSTRAPGSGPLRRPCGARV